MKVVVLAAGKLRDAWVRDGCEEYARRIRRHLPLEIVETRDSGALAARVPERFHLVALDERGREPTSAELAERLSGWMRGGSPGVAFLVGDADGLPPPLVARAHEKLALSRLTLPHRLARLLLLEQLYRALSIVRGEPYHRA
ncbi:MAG TPA: 23S rRNA (pseudouridine(1915)-N(3))-methyltransferase RlmH [Polyangiaceae bacterium]|nr:23S rRNA (pseudouridine(1915)-N(3))-methyltransferase RlmH [Polyangiaceae bacterium]